MAEERALGMDRKAMRVAGCYGLRPLACALQRSECIVGRVGSGLANERVQTTAAGQVVLKLTTPWRDGNPHLVMFPLEFMQRLAVLVPRPRLSASNICGKSAP